MIYSHRNGSTEFPTVAGWYWYLVPFVHSSIFYYNGISSMECDLGAVFYGPIPAPQHHVNLLKLASNIANGYVAVSDEEAA